MQLSRTNQRSHTMNSCRILLAVIAATVLSVGLSKADTGTPTARPATTTTAGSTTVRPIQLALFPPDLQLVRENESIGGFRLEIYGRNQDVLGVDIGLVHEATGNYHGAQFGIVNLVHGDFVGMQLAGIYSETKNHISGFQVGMVN